MQLLKSRRMAFAFYTTFDWRALLITLVFSGPAQAAISLDQAIATAQRYDPWTTGSEHRQKALEAQSTAASTLPDPVVNVGFANLPTDTFDFDQEAMTQFKVGVTQMIPRGDSTKLAQKQLSLLGSQQPHLRSDRRAQVAVTVTHLWLDTFKTTRTIRLIEEDRELFEHLVDVAQSSYSSAMGKMRQQDLIRAQLELTRLEDRLAMLNARLDIARSSLAQWLLPGLPDVTQPSAAGSGEWFELTESLPEISLTHPELLGNKHQPTRQDIAGFLVMHPAIQSIDAKIDASDVSIELAQQKYKPEWKVNASYGYREDASSGMDRPDFFSVGVAFDLPLFTSSRQDQQVQSAIASTESVRTERALVLRTMVAGVESQRARLMRLDQRHDLYQSRLLQEMHEQAEASLSAYTNDDGDFSEVVRARIAELNARIDALDIVIERLKTIEQLNYYFVQGES